MVFYTIGAQFWEFPPVFLELLFGPGVWGTLFPFFFPYFNLK